LIDAGLASVFPRPALTLFVLDESIALIGLLRISYRSQEVCNLNPSLIVILINSLL